MSVGDMVTQTDEDEDSNCELGSFYLVILKREGTCI